MKPARWEPGKAVAWWWFSCTTGLPALAGAARSQDLSGDRPGGFLPQLDAVSGSARGLAPGGRDE